MLKKISNYKNHLLVTLFIIFISTPFLENKILFYFGTCKKAVLINETESTKYHKPTLNYSFVVNSEIYKGNSDVENIDRVGDSIFIIFLKIYPKVNRNISFFDGKYKFK